MWEDTAEASCPQICLDLLSWLLWSSLGLIYSRPQWEHSPDEGEKYYTHKAVAGTKEHVLVRFGNICETGLWWCLIKGAEIQDWIREGLLTGAYALGIEFNFLIRSCSSGSEKHRGSNNFCWVKFNCLNCHGNWGKKGLNCSWSEYAKVNYKRPETLTKDVL